MREIKKSNTYGDKAACIVAEEMLDRWDPDLDAHLYYCHHHIENK